jgi:hypothetical protein
MHAALHVLSGRLGMTDDEFEKATDVMFDKMYPKSEAKKDEVVI